MEAQRVLIVARPGPVRDGLWTLLTTLPELGPVDLAEDADSALKELSEQHRSLVLLDSSLSHQEIVLVLSHCKSTSAKTRTLALAEGIDQAHAAEAAGADAVLRKGFPATELVATLRRLLRSLRTIRYGDFNKEDQ